MSESDRPPLPEVARADKAPRPDAAVPVAGRSVPVREITRELGDLDFELDELLASLRPFEADQPRSDDREDVAAPDVSPGSSALEPPKLPELELPPQEASGSPTELGATTPPQTEDKEPRPISDWDLSAPLGSSVPCSDEAPTAIALPAPELEKGAVPAVADEPFDAEEPSTRALPPVAVSPAPAGAPLRARPIRPPLTPPESRSPGRPAVESRFPRDLPALPKRSVAPPTPAPARSAPIRQTEDRASVSKQRSPDWHEPGTMRGIPVSRPPSAMSSESAAVPRPDEAFDKTLASHDASSSQDLGESRSSTAAGESGPSFDAPEVVTSDDAAILEELIVLPPDRSESLGYDSECPASEHLQARDLVDAFHSMAVILTREAQTQRHPQEQAEMAVVNSELLAMLGELDTAREYLQALAQTSTPATALLARQLAFAADDLPAYSRSIKAELRTSISLESRRHLMALYCDVLRLVPEGESEVRRHLELSSRAFPSDPRFALQRLAAQPTDRTHAKLRTPSLPESPQLSEAIRDLLALRSRQVRSGGCAHPAGPLMLAHRAFKERDLGQLLNAILDLRSIDGLASSAVWLHASLTALNPKFRDSSTCLLDQLVEAGDEEAEAAMLERRLHEKSTMLSSVEAFSTKTVAGLSPIERLSLGVALSAGKDTLQPLADGVRTESSGLPLASAVERLFSLRSASLESADKASMRLALGHTLGSLWAEAPRAADDAPSSSPAPETSSSNAAAAQAVAEDSSPSPVEPRTIGGFTEDFLAILTGLEHLAPEDRYAKVLRFWDPLSRNDPEDLAHATAELLPQLTAMEPAYLALLGAFLAQLAESRELELKLLASVSSHELPIEALCRARLACDPNLDPQVALHELASRLDDTSPRRTWLEFEASAKDRSSPEGLEEFLRQDLEGARMLTALSALLLATLAKPSTLGWSTLAKRTDAPEVRVLSGLFEALCHEVVSPSDRSRGAYLDDVALPADDPLIGSLLTALGRTPEPTRRDDHADYVAKDARLDDWLRIRDILSKVPFELDAIDAGTLEGLVARQPEPLLVSLANLVHAAKTGSQVAFERLVAAAEAAPTTEERVDGLVEASELDPNREPRLGSVAAARRILVHRPGHLQALRLMLRQAACHEEMYVTGRFAAALAPELEPGERIGHAWLALVSTIHDPGVPSAIEPVAAIESLLELGDATPLWANRRLLELARRKHDDPGILRYADRLRQSTSRSFDSATLALRAAEAASRLSQWEAVGELLGHAVQQFPEHLVALSLRAEFLEARGELRQAAMAYDALADAACMPTHKVTAWLHAATLWSKPSCGDDASDRAQLALEHAVLLEPTHVEATARLRALYVEHNQLDRLEVLLTQLLVRVEDTKDRAQIELERARVLVELGRIAEAQGGLERVLSLFPDQQQALDLSARLYEQQQDFEEAEQQWLRLASLRTDETHQAEAYQRLAALYETHLEQPARAETAYREVLRRRPNDPAADQLVQLLLRNENATAAVELLQQVLSLPTDPALERARSLQLAQIYDERLGERRRAEEILDRMRRRWQNDAQTIAALASFYRRGKDFVALGALLDRSLVDARRALGSGRFDATFFEVIACVAEQRELHDFVQITNATLAAIEARPYALEGIGARAAEALFADALAPEVLSLPLRALLRRTGWALCAANPIQLRALRASPLVDTYPELSERLRSLANSFGLDDIELHLSPSFGIACQATCSAPASLVVGPDYASLEDQGMRDALAYRALRILSANAAALASAAPVDLWPLLVAFLSVFLPGWLPPGIDKAKIEPLRDRIMRALPTTPDPDLAPLAADVAASIGSRASQLGLAVQQWGSRTALLALGDPGIILRAIAVAGGQHERLSEDPAERQKWIVRNPEARDLAIFSVADVYVETRARALGRR